MLLFIINDSWSKVKKISFYPLLIMNNSFSFVFTHYRYSAYFTILVVVKDISRCKSFCFVSVKLCSFHHLILQCFFNRYCKVKHLIIVTFFIETHSLTALKALAHRLWSTSWSNFNHFISYSFLEMWSNLVEYLNSWLWIVSVV